jgi:superfamily II DNA/RNA helicase
LKIPEKIKRGLIEELKWDRPSKIQKNAIPNIAFPDNETGTYDNLIAQAKNGAGKSGAFVIGSLMRVDTTINQAQVIVIGHTRELVN